jgi:hypothetical protein
VDNGHTNGRAKPGPKPAVTPQIKADILESLRLGLSLAAALRCANVSRQQYRTAVANDAEFNRGIKSAADQGKRHHLQRVHDAERNWQASAWFLERKYGAEFGQRVKVQTSGRVVIKAVAGASLEDL